MTNKDRLLPNTEIDTFMVNDGKQTILIKTTKLLEAQYSKTRQQTLQEVGEIMASWRIQPTLFIKLPKELRDIILDIQAKQAASNGYEASFLD